MNGGLFLKPSFYMAAMIDTFYLSGTSQIKIGYICPCLTPKEELLFAVPTLRAWILSAIFGAFVVLEHPFIALRLFKLGGSEALFLAVLDTEIFFLGLVLPFSLFIHGRTVSRMWRGDCDRECMDHESPHSHTFQMGWQYTSPVVTWRRKLLVRFSFLFLREAQFPPARFYTFIIPYASGF